jgi:hypothetical protein
MGLLDEFVAERVKKTQEDIDRKAGKLPPETGLLDSIKNIAGAATDGQFWRDIGTNAAGLPKQVSRNASRLVGIPGHASDVADNIFPESARDSSVKNAFRHSLGTGLLAQEFGADRGGLQSVIAPLVAKNVGYFWEALDAPKYMRSPSHALDTKHDLNANAIGAMAATGAKDEASLVEILKRKALEAPISQPPGLLSLSPGYLTRTER